MATPERMGRPWVALHAHILDDQRLADAGDDVFALYCRLLAYAGAEGRDGIVNYDPGKLAWRLRIPLEKLTSTLNDLVCRGMVSLEDGTLRITDWHLQSRETQAERMRRTRAEERQGATVRTPCARRTNGVRTPCVLDVDRDVDADGDGEAGGMPPRAKARLAPIRKKRTLPNDWGPNETHRRLAAEQGVDLETETVKFRDHHTAKASLFADWDAALRQWIRGARRYGSPSRVGGLPSPGRSERIIAAGAEALRLVNEAEARRRAEQ